MNLFARVRLALLNRRMTRLGVPTQAEVFTAQGLRF